MNTFRSSVGLGSLATDDYSDEPWLGPSTPSTPGTPTKPSITDVLKDWFGVAKEGVEVYNQYRDGSTTPNFNNTTPPPPAPSNNMGTLLKYGLITAGVGLVAYGGYQALKGKKKGK